MHASAGGWAAAAWLLQLWSAAVIPQGLSRRRAFAGIGPAPVSSVLRPLGGLDSLQRARSGCVDALVPVVPADAIARVSRTLHDLLDYARPGRPVGRLGLDLHAISGLELHALSS